MDELEIPWYSPEWFYPATFEEFVWDHPNVLWALPVVFILFLARWLFQSRLMHKVPIAVTDKELKGSASSWLRFIPELLMFITALLLVVALARPQRSNEKVDQWTEGIDIMLALDISRSMDIEDLLPNRLEAAKQVAHDFIDGRKQDRIGLVIFSGDAFSLAPLTTDYELLHQYVTGLEFDMIESRGTAIGSALAVVTNRMRESTAKSKVCILLSDGSSNAGNIDPITAAQLATAYDIKIYTILVGKEGLVPRGTDMFGNPQLYPNTVDESAMREIATIGSGEFFRATNNQALQAVFERIDEYEKAEIKETRYRNTSDYYYIYLHWAMVFFLLWLLLKSTFMINVLQD